MNSIINIVKHLKEDSMAKWRKDFMKAEEKSSPALVDAVARIGTTAHKSLS
jgi:hypothetical protein